MTESASKLLFITVLQLITLLTYRDTETLKYILITRLTIVKMSLENQANTHFLTILSLRISLHEVAPTASLILKLKPNILEMVICHNISEWANVTK